MHASLAPIRAGAVGTVKFWGFQVTVQWEMLLCLSLLFLVRSLYGSSTVVMFVICICVTAALLFPSRIVDFFWVQIGMCNVSVLDLHSGLLSKP